ncbi:MAG: hypothetical protein K8R76_11340 [Candidatus Aegiribacteria sp.]|nr:hypothetical protein [Candidatus Aegiribacteria sp.]
MTSLLISYSVQNISSAENLGAFLESTDTSFVDTTVVGGTTYYVALATVLNSDDDLLWSNEVCVTIPCTGTLPTVTGLTIDEALSEGMSVVLNWNPVAGDADGYVIYFKANAKGGWVSVGDVSLTTFNHQATCAGLYSVKAYLGSEFSENYSNTVSTMPNEISTLYTIWDNHAPEYEYNAFIFGAISGIAGFAASSSFIQDIYCYDGNWPISPVGFFSGAAPPFGNGYETMMFAWGEQGWINYGAAPGGTYAWWVMGYIIQDDVIFAHLHDGYFVKIYVVDIPQHPDQPLSYGITFHYEYQCINGLALFTTDNTMGIY